MASSSPYQSRVVTILPLKKMDVVLNAKSQKGSLKKLSIDYCSAMVAIPDFKYNAMENWGLILFRETKVLLPLYQNSLK